MPVLLSLAARFIKTVFDFQQAPPGPAKCQMGGVDVLVRIARPAGLWPDRRICLDGQSQGFSADGFAKCGSFIGCMHAGAAAVFLHCAIFISHSVGNHCINLVFPRLCLMEFMAWFLRHPCGMPELSNNYLRKSNFALNAEPMVAPVTPLWMGIDRMILCPAQAGDSLPGWKCNPTSIN